MLRHSAPAILTALAVVADLSAQLTVTAASPRANGTMLPMQKLSVTFSHALDPATANGTTISAFGRWSGPVTGVVTLSPDALTLSVQPLRPLFAGEQVTVTVTDGLTDTNGNRLSAGHSLHYWVQPAPGSRSFTLDQTIPQRLPGETRTGMYGIYAGDLDRDGSPDVTSMNEISNDIRVQYNSGCGSFSSFVTNHTPGQWPSANEGADFNRDGWLDLVTGNQYGGAISIFLNDGQGTLLPPMVLQTSGYVHGVACADFDGDGWWDIAAANRTHVFVFLNLQNGQFSAGAPYDAGGNGEDNVCAADVDHDGDIDLMIGNQYTTNMGVLLGNGDGTFTLGFVGPVGGQPFSQAVGDLDGDGHIDVAFANRGTNTIGVLLGDGQGGFGTPQTYPVGLTPAAIDIGDLDGDGDLDAVTSNFTSGNYTIWWNRGDAVFESPTTLAGTQAGSCTTLVDYDRDGVLDIITSDEYADVAVFYRQQTPFELLQSQPTGQTQLASCGATLRVDQRADLAGLNGQAPAPITAGEITVFGVSGPSGGIAVIGVGVLIEPGLPVLNYGLLHFDPQHAAHLTFQTLDQHGETLMPTLVPSNLPPGLRFTVQGAAGTASDLKFTNAHRLEIR
jgi:hypothetical protein